MCWRCMEKNAGRYGALRYCATLHSGCELNFYSTTVISIPQAALSRRVVRLMATPHVHANTSLQSAENRGKAKN